MVVYSDKFPSSCIDTFMIAQTSLTGIVPFEVCNIRNGRVYITSRCEIDELLCCCTNSCGWDSGGSVGYGGGSLCDNITPRPETCDICESPPFS